MAHVDNSNIMGALEPQYREVIPFTDVKRWRWKDIGHPYSS